MTWEWTDRDGIVTEDGTRISLFSEHIRGEPRFYWAEYQNAGQDRWRSIGGDGSYDKRTIKRRMESFANGLQEVKS